MPGFLIRSQTAVNDCSGFETGSSAADFAIATSLSSVMKIATINIKTKRIENIGTSFTI
ncbi:MAG: hypothetical protein AB7V56_00615 [Candidatus Nitrosocosmicus sp.]|nr:hypothetical protein [Candidatus Nitrosocosmicus sp.]